MTESGSSRQISSLTTSDQQWDKSVERLGGHLLQSLAWGDFKSRHGWEVERISVGSDTPAAMAQVLFRRRGPFSLAYIPRGPVFLDGDTASVTELVRQIDGVCKARNAIHLIVESDRPLPLTGRFREHGFVRGPEHFQPCRTVKVPLLDDDALLAQMHQKTRYSVRLAYRRGVEIKRLPPTDESVQQFYALLSETSSRNEFGIHEADYYGDFLRSFGDKAILLLAYVDHAPAAGVISARFGPEAIYMYGASSSTNRAHGAAFALQFEVMRWARELGCETYDLWGIPAQDPNTIHEDGNRVAGTKGDDWSGLYKFKVGFGGRIVNYPPTIERRYRPFLSFAARRLYANRGE